ncbi:entericidin EcnA/B family protein [Sediminimonas sp.]|nr:entericidin EcnA/B family protein [Sediminimonas sp.]
MKPERSLRGAVALVMLGLLTGCATVDGMGQDISGGARWVQSWF